MITCRQSLSSRSCLEAGLASLWLRLSAIGFLVVTLSGCSSRRPLEAWRQEVTRFVAIEGNGDPDCLRDTSDFRSRRAVRPAALTISSTQGADARSHDASGVLVGQCQVNGRPWYVFLVAIIDQQGRKASEIESVRPVAFTADAEGLHWFTPRQGDKTASAYLDSSRQQMAMLATRYATFPGPKDVFEMRTRDSEITILERNSGARWTMQIPASPVETSDDNGERRTVAAGPAAPR